MTAELPESFLLVTPGGTWTLDALRDRAVDLLPSPTPRIWLESATAEHVVAALCTLDGQACEVHLLPQGVSPDSTPIEELPGTTSWVLYTSGTTGQPKPILHTLRSLSRTVSTRADTSSLRWGLLYDPTRMAGLQVILQALTSGATLACPDSHQDLAGRIAWLREQGVNALSATPTLWRQILQSGAASGWDLAQITLGGEIADQRVLDALAKAFPQARIVHVFAATETGAAFGVSDGREGFPVGYLTQGPKGIRLRVQNDILQVYCPTLPHADADGFVSTGDVVTIAGDRVLFKGRASGVVNVGGTNVWPEQVETLLRTHDAVLDAVVTARSNPMSGAILTARVVTDAVSQVTGSDIRKWMLQQTSAPFVPATIRVVDSLSVGTTGKAQRR